MRQFVKQIVRFLFQLAAFPLWLTYRLESACVGQSRAIAGWSQLLCWLPGICGEYLRLAFYSRVLPKVGSDAVIGFGVLLCSSKTCIGRKAYIGPYCILGEVDIGDDVLFGSQVSVTNGAKQHGIDRLDVPIREQPGTWPRISIGQDSWVGDRAIIMADVGEHCVVGAGAVVTKPVPDFAIVVGNPAQVIKYRNDSKWDCPVPVGSSSANA